MGVQRLKVSMETSVIQQVFTATHRDVTYIHILMWNWHHLLLTTLHAFFKLGLNLLIIRSWTKEVLRPPAEVKGWTREVHHCDHRWNGSEQNKHTQIAQNTKSTQNLWRARTHLTGAGFYDLLQWPHDCNLTIYILLSIIQQLPKRIPEVLNLQLDNCFRENNNKYVSSWWNWKFSKRCGVNFYCQFKMSSGPLAIHTHTHTTYMCKL